MVPVAIARSLPDYLVRTEQYAQRMRFAWQCGDRFRVVYGGAVSKKTGKKTKSGGLPASVSGEQKD